MTESILIVDDNEQSLNLLSHFISQKGYADLTANNGKQALELLETQAFDLILLDLMMPEVSGFDVLKVIRQHHSLLELPVIVVTADYARESIVEAIKLGANDYIIKPVEFDILKARIETQIELKHKDQAYKAIKENLEQLVKQKTEQLTLSNKQLQQDRKRFDYFLSSSPAITYATSCEANHICNYVSENLREIMGYKSEKMINDPDFWYVHIHPEDRQEVLYKIEDNLKKGGGTVEYRFLHFNGEYMWVSDTHRVVMENNNPVEIIGTWTDVTKQHLLKQDMLYKNTHDELTGLINRKTFEKQLEYVISNEMGNTVQHVICYMDIDQFKVINDTYGHVAGDELLRHLSKELTDNLSRRDTLAYFGGDEFCILLRYCTLNQAHRILELLRQLIHEFRFSWDGKKHAITASMGVVAVDRHYGSAAKILSIADTVCHSAKEAGRDRITIYNGTDESLNKKREQMSWVEKINQALDEDRFQLFYQPIIGLYDKDKVQHFELLIRLVDKTGNIISPGAFLPAAEHYNLSAKIDRWVIQTTLSWLEAYSELLEYEYVWGINLSGQSLADEDLLKFVISDFDHKKIPPQKVYFEITETAAIGNLDNAIQFIQAMKKYGCRFALDDFGSGLSSFSYLKNLPVDFLKIDGMFVRDIATNNIDFAMVKAINDIGHAMNKKTIAEFVENDEIIKTLKSIGVDFAQGYGIEKPKPLSEFASNIGLAR